MKCPNCGAEMKEGTLYCEHCGEDIHIVPDFEPEIEYNMEQTLHDIAREMTPEEDATDDQDAQQSMTELQDWDEEPLENTAKHPFRWKFIVLILVLAGHSLILPGAKEGLSFYLLPDFKRASEVGLGSVIMAAMNQSFFTLSLGIAAMEIFGSYMSDANRLPGEAVRICCLDTFVALMSGMIIFPACFSFGLEPGQGPSLIFMTLPRVFVSMTGGRLWGALFFLFLTFASFTTVLAVFENIMASCMDNFGWSRKKATIVCGIFILLASMPCVLGYNLWYFEASLPSGATGQILDIEDFLVSNLLLPIGSLIYLLFCVSKWGWGFDKYLAEANKGTGLGMSPRFKIYFQFILPMLILVILLVGLGSWGWRALICAAVAVFVWFMARRSSSKSTI